MSVMVSRFQPKTNEPKYNPLSPASDNFCEKIYKSLGDGQGGFQDRVVRLCELLDIDVKDLAPK
jgi:hypothetical protein